MNKLLFDIQLTRRGMCFNFFMINFILEFLRKKKRIFLILLYGVKIQLNYQNKGKELELSKLPSVEKNKKRKRRPNL